MRFAVPLTDVRHGPIGIMNTIGLFKWREQRLVMAGTEAIHYRKSIDANLLHLKSRPLHPHYGEQRGRDSYNMPLLRYMLQLRTRNDVSTDDLTFARRLIASS